MTTILIGIFIFLLTILNSIGIVVGFFNRPTNTVYLGTIHYFEDYFLYINHFFQGAHGAFLTANRYTNETTPSSILYWTDVVMGKLGALIGLSPIGSYHMWLILLTIITLCVMYVLLLRMFPKSNLHALLGFLFATLSTSLINHIYVNGNPMWYPFQLWKTPHFAFDRLGGVPHQTLQSLLFFVLTILCLLPTVSRKNLTIALIALVSFTLTTLQPIQAMIFLAVYLTTQIVLYVHKKPTSVAKLAVLFFSVTCTFVYMYVLSTTLPHSQARMWDGLQQTTTTLPFLLLSLGPISILFLLGILPSILSGNPLFLFAIILVVSTYGVFLSPIPHILGISNLRIIFPAIYPFMAVVAVQGVLFIAKKLSKIISIATTINAIMAIFILMSLPTLYWEIQQKILSQEDVNNQTIYLSNTLSSMFTFLQTTGKFKDVVLSNPASHMDTLTPALSGHTTYSGHMLLTIDNTKKQDYARQFFSLVLPDAKNWLIKNNIRYILFTHLDGDLKKFTTAYPFLTLYKSFGESEAIFSL